jgi:hypothetical protein
MAPWTTGPTTEGHVPQPVTCIAHGLRRICESIRENGNSVKDFIAALKKILVKTPSRQVLYQEVTFRNSLSSQGGVLG